MSLHLRVIGRGRLALARRRERKLERRLVGVIAADDARRRRPLTIEELAANRELPMLQDPRRTGGHD